MAYSLPNHGVLPRIQVPDVKFPPVEQVSDPARGLGAGTVASSTEELIPVLYRFAQSVTCCNSSTNGLGLKNGNRTEEGKADAQPVFTVKALRTWVA